MPTSKIKRIGGWAGLASGILYLLAFVALVLFFVVEYEQAVSNNARGVEGFYPFGFASDLLPVFAAAATLILVGVLYGLLRDSARGWSLLGAAFGVVGGLTLLLTNLLFVLHAITLGQQGQYSFLAFAPTGAWLALVNLLARRSGLLSPRLSLLGLVVGIGEVVAVAVAIPSGALPMLATGDFASISGNPPLLISLSVGFLMGLLGGAVWPLGVGRALLRSQLKGE